VRTLRTMSSVDPSFELNLPEPPGAGPAGEKPAKQQWVNARQVQRVVTRVDPWSMLRITLSFALCLWLILVVASVLIWQVAIVTGSIGKIENFLAQLLAESTFTINGITLLKGSVAVGLILLATGALLAPVVSVLFNLVAPIFGGLRFTVVELETAQPAE